MLLKSGKLRSELPIIFLKEEDIEYFRPLILNTYLGAVELKFVPNENENIIVFVGVAD